MSRSKITREIDLITQGGIGKLDFPNERMFGMAFSYIGFNFEKDEK